MQKLKIRQRWSSHGSPWYVIYYGEKANEYVLGYYYNLNEKITLARFLQMKVT